MVLLLTAATLKKMILLLVQKIVKMRMNLKKIHLKNKPLIVMLLLKIWGLSLVKNLMIMILNQINFSSALYIAPHSLS